MYKKHVLWYLKNETKFYIHKIHSVRSVYKNMNLLKHPQFNRDIQNGKILLALQHFHK